jgi:hypothetical protein
MDKYLKGLRGYFVKAFFLYQNFTRFKSFLNILGL